MHIGLDIGGTKTDAVITDGEGAVLHRHRLDTGHGPDVVLATAAEAMANVCDAAGINPSQAASIGVGIPGGVDDGVVTHALNLGIERLDLGSALAATWGMRPVVDNDVNAAAVGAWILARNGSRSVAYLNIGTGLAAGIVLDGKIWRGANGAAGEIGYVAVDPAGPVDADGLHGCLETYAAGSGIVRQAGGGTTATEVLATAETDELAGRIRDRLYFGVASAVRLLVLTLDVEEVVIGGGLVGIGEPLLEGARRKIAAWEARSAFLTSVALGERMRLLDAKLPIAAIGAAMRGAGRG